MRKLCKEFSYPSDKLSCQQLTFVRIRRITFGQDFKWRVKWFFRRSPINGTPVGPITPSLIFMHPRASALFTIFRKK
uniref:Uncharacterized protein n=1 Tax=Paraburkholderia sprentiae WSM5005 TaxID=754502 RepID=A0A1I9YJJ6_9BURK